MNTTNSNTATATSGVAPTIPNCTATHVLGSTSLPLATGPLSLLAAPTLTIQIGTRAFPLPAGTPFGTDASNPRAYVFTPAGLDEQGGYVRIELPADVSADAHVEFERALIAAGHLVEGDVENDGTIGSAGTWLGRKVEGIKGAVSGGLATEGGGVPTEAIKGSDE